MFFFNLWGRNLEKSLRLCEQVVYDDDSDFLRDFRASGSVQRFVGLMRKSALASLEEGDTAWTAISV
jgi:hypothetical protein